MNAKRMVEVYLAPRGITDPRVLEAMKEIPRHIFVPEILRERAYSDHPLPIGHDQTISQPLVVAYMSQALELKGTETILEIGTGSGYQAAVLSKLAKRVFSVERVRALSIEARKRLDQLHIHNVSTRCSNGQTGWQEYSPFDHIMVTASMTQDPVFLMDQLKEGGTVVAPMNEGKPEQMLYRFIKHSDHIEKQALRSCAFVPFIHA